MSWEKETEDEHNTEDDKFEDDSGAEAACEVVGICLLDCTGHCPFDVFCHSGDLRILGLSPW